MNDNMRNDVTARMSARLLAVADMMGNKYETDEKSSSDTRSFKCVADVGCDHGYVSIYLVQKSIADRAIAMDVRKGPLSMAEDNIRLMGLSGRIDVRLSDGLSGLKKGEADGLVIAGMGGRLVMSILEQSDVSSLGIRMALLQPQSELQLFREYLSDKGYRIIDERIIYDEGKYYFPMLVSFGSEGMSALNSTDEAAVKDELSAVKELICGKVPDNEIDTAARRLSFRYGALNILRSDPLLKPYLEHGREVAQSVLANLDQVQHPKRFRELKQELGDIELLLHKMKLI